MKEATAKKLAAAVIDMLNSAGMSAFDLLGAIVNVPIPKKQKRLLQSVFQGTFVHQFKKEPEPTPEKVAEFIAITQAFKQTPYKLKKFLMERAKEIPRGPSGPPRKIARADEAAVCAEIATLRTEHDTRDAIRRVAQKRGVSERTVYRIWGSYHPKKRTPKKL